MHSINTISSILSFNTCYFLEKISNTLRFLAKISNTLRWFTWTIPYRTILHENSQTNQLSWRKNLIFFLDENPYKTPPNTQLDTNNLHPNDTPIEHHYNVMLMCMHRLGVEYEEWNWLILWFHQVMNDAWGSIYNFGIFRAKRDKFKIEWFIKIN